MEDFTFNGKTVEFWEISGQVISTDKFSETHVYSQGGGPVYGGGSSLPSVHSNVVTKQEFWLKTVDGAEKSIQLAGADVPLRVGQKVTVIAAKRQGSDSSGCYVALVNHTAKSPWFFYSANTYVDRFGLAKLSLVLCTLKSLCVWILVFLVSLTFLGTDAANVFGLVTASFYLVYVYVVWLDNQTTAIKLFSDHLTRISKSTEKLE